MNGAAPVFGATGTGTNTPGWSAASCSRPGSSGSPVAVASSRESAV